MERDAASATNTLTIYPKSWLLDFGSRSGRFARDRCPVGRDRDRAVAAVGRRAAANQRPGRRARGS